MNEALEKIKSELMLLGFLSLLLTFGTNYIKKICIPHSIGDTMLPCKKVVSHGGDGRRRLLSFETEDDNDVLSWRRILATSISGDDYCSTKGKVPLISASGLHQLHIFVFVLAVSHIFYSVMTMVLSQAKMKKWKSWEAETSSLEYQFSNDPARFRLAHQTSFVKQHSGWSRMPGIRWIVAFFRQFFASVTKVDYMTMRHGFINILLLVGTKLELIIMEMAQEIQDRTTIVRGVPVVEPNNKYFWFNRPQWILFLIHFTLFQNAFQIALFLWTVYEFKIKSCFHENLKLILIRVILGVFLQFICSYITFPLYALITQMGSHMKKAIFEEQTAKAIKKWQKTAKNRTKLRKAGMDNVSNSGYMSGETTPSQGTSPIHLLHKYKPSSNHTDTESVLYSPRSYPSDTELSETELAYTHHHHIQLNEITTSHGHGPPNNRQETHNVDFSFDKP
ncbi:MLO-like protein [Arachis hypogaea]|nr:MLO-like protein [Arachis hypogaea]